MSASSGVPIAGVAGWPVAHSRSPIIHRHWLDRLGVAGGYERFAVQPGAFAQFAAGIGRGDLVGSNVTVPHKEAAFAACDRRTAVAETLGAVNTLWREGSLLWGDNTDVEGFLANMDEGAPGWSGGSRSAVVVGRGRRRSRGRPCAGVARLRPNRHRQSNAGARRGAGGPIRRRGDSVCLDGACRASCAGADLLVNASSLGMQGQPPLEIDLDLLPDHAVVSDIVYVPLRTPLVRGGEGARSARGRRSRHAAASGGARLSNDGSAGAPR